MLKLEEDKSKYESIAKEAVQKALEDKLEAMAKVAQLEAQLKQATDELNWLKEQANSHEQEIKAANERNEKLIKDIGELITKVQESEENLRKLTEASNMEKERLHETIRQLRSAHDVTVNGIESETSQKPSSQPENLKPSFENGEGPPQPATQLDELPTACQKESHEGDQPQPMDTSNILPSKLLSTSTSDSESFDENSMASQSSQNHSDVSTVLSDTISEHLPKAETALNGLPSPDHRDKHILNAMDVVDDLESKPYKNEIFSAAIKKEPLQESSSPSNVNHAIEHHLNEVVKINGELCSTAQSSSGSTERDGSFGDNDFGESKQTLTKQQQLSPSKLEVDRLFDSLAQELSENKSQIPVKHHDEHSLPHYDEKPSPSNASIRTSDHCAENDMNSSMNESSASGGNLYSCSSHEQDLTTNSDESMRHSETSLPRSTSYLTPNRSTPSIPPPPAREFADGLASGIWLMVILAAIVINIYGYFKS